MTMLRSKSEMKDSGIDWIGEIPKTWSIGRIKSNYEIVLGKMLQNQPAKTTDTLENYLCATNIKWLGIDTSVSKQMWFSTNEKSQYLLDDGDVVVMEGGTAGTAAIYNGEFAPCYMQNSVNRCRTKGQYLNKYLFYWLYHVFHVGYIASICNKATIMHYTKEKLANTPLLAVPISEQQAIVSYLDDRCSKLDEIITEAEKSIEEYKELKQAVIDQYSMFGINKDVNIRDTDYFWFPYMPSHWKLIRANRLFKEDVRPVQDGDISLSLSQVDGLIPTDDMSERSLKSATHDNWKHVIPEDLVLNRFKGHLGVFFASKYEGMVSFHYGVYHAIREGVLSKYYEYLFHSTTYKNIFALLSNGVTVGLQNLSNSNFYSVKLLLPPIEEQIDIVKYLDEHIARIDSLISEKQSLIEDLKAYKKSFIYEVVTGKRRVV